jgi:hypothetical protein
LTGLFLLAIGFAVVGLATWLAAKFFWSRRVQSTSRSVITADYERVSEEPDRPSAVILGQDPEGDGEFRTRALVERNRLAIEWQEVPTSSRHPAGLRSNMVGS